MLRGFTFAGADHAAVDSCFSSTDHVSENGVAYFFGRPFDRLIEPLRLPAQAAASRSASSNTLSDTPRFFKARASRLTESELWIASSRRRPSLI